MNSEIKAKWNKRHAEAGDVGQPAKVLADYAHLLPASGQALDLACGRGRNAIFLARQGLTVDAWDISEVAIERLSAVAAQESLAIHAAVRDVVAAPPATDSYDVIVVSYFLERTLAPALIAALRPGGLLFYQTFGREKVSDNGPGNPAFRLAPNELLQLFSPLRVLAYRDEGAVGDSAKGFRDEALLVARRSESC